MRCATIYGETVDVVEKSELILEEWNNIEVIWVEIIFHSQRLLFSTMYRQPRDVNFYPTLEKQLECVCRKNKNIMIMGDFNTNLLNIKENRNADCDKTDRSWKLIHILKHFGLVNVIKQPTRITRSSQTLIDLSIVGNKNKVLNAGVLDTGIADHRLIFSVLKLSRKKTPSIRTVNDWKNCNQEAFNEQIALAPWHICNVF